MMIIKMIFSNSWNYLEMKIVIDNLQCYSTARSDNHNISIFFVQMKKSLFRYPPARNVCNRNFTTYNNQELQNKNSRFIRAGALGFHLERA